MTPEEHARVGELFLLARELGEADQQVFLREHCPQELRAEVASLLQEQSEAFLGIPALGETFQLSKTAPDVPESDREIIDGYELQSILGEGGFGIVYLARQIEPIEREVAIKILKPGMDSLAIDNRFRFERHTLASMQHPGIATVHDAGTTATGRPYIVMEYSPGEPITAFCDRHRLSIVDRLQLFDQVCDAVEHAHQRGIIHRGLKPSNVLVEQTAGGPRACIIDFGIAKAITEGPADGHTVSGQTLGTPEYMSPEQMGLLGGDVGTRSDIYALGMILYELLTGVRARDYGDSPPAETLERTRREPAVRPSTRLEQLDEETAERIAKARRASPAAHQSLLRGELEWIPLQAIRSDPQERYQSIGELRADLCRFKEHQPLQAGPDRLAYRVRKFVRRNRTAVLVGGSVGLIVLVAVGALIMALAEAARQGSLAATRLIEQTRQANRSKLAGADAAMLAGGAGAALYLLEQVPDSDRAWPWRYLWASADASGWTLQLEPEPSAIVPAGVGRFAVAGPDGVVRLLSDTGKLLQKIDAHDVPVSCIATDTGVIVFGDDLDTPAWEGTGHGEEVIAVRFSPDGQTLASLDWNSEVRLWSAGGKPIGNPLRTNRIIANPTRTLRGGALAFSPDGAYLASSSWENAITIWDLSDGSEHTVLTGYTSAITGLDWVSQRLFSSSLDSTVRSWDPLAGSGLATLRGHAAPIIAAAFASDGNSIATAALDGQIKSWSPDIGVEHGPPFDLEQAEIITHAANQTTLTKPRSDETIVVDGHEIAVQLPSGAHPIAVSPDGLFVATGEGRNILIRAGDGLGPIARLTGHIRAPADLMFLPDGRLAAVDDDGIMAIWSPDSPPVTLRNGNKKKTSLIL